MAVFFSDDDKWNALVQRDRQFNGVFFYGVLTTGVYCRPVCATRLPNRENVRFFSASEEAENAGFRPCKRCHPNDKDWQDSQTQAVLNACRMIEDADTPPKLKELADKAGFSSFHFHKLFKKIIGITPKHYAMEIRLKKVRSCLQSRQTVTETIYNSGFETSSRFYEKSTTVLGMRPSAYKNGAPDIIIQHTVVQSYLGWVLVAWTDKGICSVTLGDTPGKLKADLYRRFPKAKFNEPDSNFEEILVKVLSVIEMPHSRSFELPLDIQGTAFQRSVWDALQKIAPGSTESYSEIAARIGKPSAARAVARACAANPFAVVIPCHRVVRSNGDLSGYRWGIERKKSLLARENQASVGAVAYDNRLDGKTEFNYFSYGQAEIEYLSRCDRILGKAIDNIGIIERQVTPDLFTALIKSIVEQQISRKAAETVWGRLCEQYLEITPRSIAGADVSEIQKCGLSMRKAGYIKGIGDATVCGELNLLEFSEMPDNAIIKRLSSLNGIGVWTAEMLLIFSLCRPDIVSWGDLAIRRGMMNLYELKTLTKEQFDRYRKRYSPCGSVASLYLWALSVK